MAKLSHSLIVMAMCLTASASAQNVEVEQSGKALKLRGVAPGVRVLLSGEHASGVVQGRLRVAAGTNTTLNGQRGDLWFNGISSVSVSFAASDNFLVIRSLQVDGALALQGSAAVVVAQVLAKSLTFDSGKGELGFDCLEGHFSDRLRLKSGAGDDFARVNCTVEGDLQLALGDGNNRVQVGKESVMDQRARSITVKTGSGDDSFALLGCKIDKTLKVELGGGSNHASFTDSNVTGPVTYKGGGGVDVLDLERFWDSTSMKASLGAGANFATFRDALIQRPLVVEGGPDVDRIRFWHTISASTTTLKLGNGDNSLDVERLSVHEKLTYSGGSGRDVTYAQVLRIGGDASFRLGDADNAIELVEPLIWESLSVTGGSGDETVFLTMAEIDDVKLELGGGDNLVGLGPARIENRLSVTTGPGDDRVAFNDPSEVAAVELHLGGGANRTFGSTQPVGSGDVPWPRSP